MNALAKNVAKLGLRAASAAWKPYSRLVLISDKNNWSLDHDRQEIKTIAEQLGIQTAPAFWRFSASPQAHLFFSHYSIAEDQAWLHSNHRIGITFPEGVPPAALKDQHPVFQVIRSHHHRLERIQVSHLAMKNYILESGIAPEKVFVIPIGVNLELFRYRDQNLGGRLRAQLGIPAEAFVVGSFQKDGNGWDEGLEPKLVKGPDIFLETIEKLKPVIPELFVLIIGPARGYIRVGLERLGVPFVWVKQQPYAQVCLYYSTLNLYLVTSRQEGGPKAVLESMASGVPLITTRVGQAMDLVQHGQNGFMVDVEDVNGLADWAKYIHQNRGAALETLLGNARATAEANSYQAQIHLWHDFMKGFVEWKD